MRKKCLVNVLLSGIMCVSMTFVPVKANEDDLYAGYTPEEVELIKELESKDSNFNIEDGEVVSIEKQIVKFENGNGQATYGAIGEDYMELTVAAQRINKSNTEYDDYKFVTVATWLMVPAFRMQDAIAIAWSDEFSQYSHSCEAYYKTVGKLDNKTSQIKSAPEVGVAYSVEASDYYGQALDYVVLSVAAKKKNTEDGTGVVSASYAHAIVSVSSGFSVSFGKDGGISFDLTGLGAYQEAAVDDDFFY